MAFPVNTIIVGMCLAL
jgi:hypothetical protein